MPGRSSRRAVEDMSTPSRLIVIAQPGRQHSDQLAAALVEHGYEVEYLHGSAIRPALRPILAGHARRWPIVRLIGKIAGKLLRGVSGERFVQSTYALFDRKVAREIRKRRPAAVIVYENSAIESLRAARDVGAIGILDAADVHYRLQNEAITPFRELVNRSKDVELSLIDSMLTCSNLARDSYIANGVPAGKVVALPLGVDLADFRPTDEEKERGVLRILFVGRLTYKKGIDTLVAALDLLRSRGIPFELQVAAALDHVEFDSDRYLGAMGKLLGKVRHEDLPALYAWGDLLVVPSRFDSFGLVVYEALACGLPTLVSDAVGSKDIVVEGINGFVVPTQDAAALADRLAASASDIDAVRAMRKPARISVEAAGWANYRRRAAKVVTQMIGAYEGPPSSS